MKPKPERTADRHKKAKMIRVRDGYDVQLEKLASARNSTVTQVVNDAIRKELEAENLWPVSAK